MTDKENKAIQAKEKKGISVPAEQTKPGLVFTPSVDIFETDQEIILEADMPGVKSENLSINLHDNVLTLDGEIHPPEGPDEVDVIREYRTGRYIREFSLSEVIDRAKIEAELKDGVLKLILPKVQAEKPRKIQVKTA